MTHTVDSLMALADAYASSFRDSVRRNRNNLHAALTEALSQSPILGTKTWIEGGVVMTQNLTASDIYQPPQAAQPVREPLPDAWIRERTKQPWIFETVKQWVREIELAHGIGSEK